MDTAIMKASCARPGKAVICIFLTPRALWRSRLSVRVPGCQKNTNYRLTRSGTGCFISVHIWHQWASKGYFIRLYNNGNYLLPHVHALPPRRLWRLVLIPQLQTISDAPGAPGFPLAKSGPGSW